MEFIYHLFFQLHCCDVFTFVIEVVQAHRTWYAYVLIHNEQLVNVCLLNIRKPRIWSGSPWIVDSDSFRIGYFFCFDVWLVLKANGSWLRGGPRVQKNPETKTG